MDSRTAAFRILLELERGTRDRIDGGEDAALGLSGPDAGLARELSLGACTHARLYDWLSARFLRPGQQPIELIIALRICCHQLFALDRVPSHAAVGTTVSILKQVGMPHLGGVANAVGRKLSTLRQESRSLPGPLGRLSLDDRPFSVAVAHGLPDLLIDDLGPLIQEPRDAFLVRLNQRPHLCTRNRPGAPATVGRSILRREGPWTWWGDPAEALHGPVADGRCVVQDRAQGQVCDMVFGTAKARPGDLVLDLCASPGGKALALADAGLRVVAGDVSRAKCRDIPQELPRLVQDGCHPALAAAFEIVLVDAPCSNTGVLGRRPEARRRYDRHHRDQLIALQRELLRAAAGLVAPGGRLIYSTCSVSPPENQGVAQYLEGWRLLGEHLTWPDEWLGGGYAAVLIRS